MSEKYDVIRLSTLALKIGEGSHIPKNTGSL